MTSSGTVENNSQMSFFIMSFESDMCLNLPFEYYIEI